MTQSSQQLFLEFLAEPGQARFHGLVRLTGFIGQLLKRALVHIGGLNQLAFLRRQAGERIAKNLGEAVI